MDSNAREGNSESGGGEAMKTTYKPYVKTATQEMRPYVPGEDLAGISVSPEDMPEDGGMIARNHCNHSDKWYVSKAFFEANYAQAPGPDGLTFGQALELLKQGKKVARAGWNGRGMFIWLNPAVGVRADWCKDPTLKKLAQENGGSIPGLGTICMYTVDSTGRKAILTGWLASQSDLLLSDWAVVE